jgi:hypothetical protein
MSKNNELELYKLINEEELVSEFGWCSDDSCCAWIDYRNLDEFMIKVIEIFGYSMFDDGGFNANMQSDGVCIDLCEMFGCYLSVEGVFSKDKYRH